ncbi:hypothetical protein PF005_g3738 [Phytophthora fragariae]|uniref:Secreted protein n=1 Tax=Phytophthora fragariae TaxID=53985 RepID=A0A6A4A9C0_9STRA|nr:hypothetical protein PF003_g35072 [Phytophthora fragariae]KAE8947159.1 hypothetical protein PF009_g3232 [Phytophthora fragariae]KAE9025854.1 hypothetical protein PF011_g2850 [Phytophthora fragariae]KAE9132608.1 hypothetical protein PF007_g3671 [Phytophthora fragariae]KAE9133192.1 hypothetical protein PF010_g2909 [Phytophthora fragariae]
MLLQSTVFVILKLARRGSAYFVGVIDSPCVVVPVKGKLHRPRKNNRCWFCFQDLRENGGARRDKGLQCVTNRGTVRVSAEKDA